MGSWVFSWRIYPANLLSVGMVKTSCGCWGRKITYGPRGANKPILQLENRAHFEKKHIHWIYPPMQDVRMANKGLGRGNWHPG